MNGIKDSSMELGVLWCKSCIRGLIMSIVAPSWVW